MSCLVCVCASFSTLMLRWSCGSRTCRSWLSFHRVGSRDEARSARCVTALTLLVPTRPGFYIWSLLYNFGFQLCLDCEIYALELYVFSSFLQFPSIMLFSNCFFNLVSPSFFLLPVFFISFTYHFYNYLKQFFTAYSELVFPLLFYDHQWLSGLRSNLF